MKTLLMLMLASQLLQASASSEVDIETIGKDFISSNQLKGDEKLNEIRKKFIDKNFLSAYDSDDSAIEHLCGDQTNQVKKQVSITIADILRFKILKLHPSRRKSYTARDQNSKRDLAVGLSERPQDFAKALKGRSARELRDKIEQDCMSRPRDEIFCEHLPELVDIVDTYEKVKDERGSSEKWNAYRIHFLVLRHNDPEQFARVKPRTDENIQKLVIDSLKTFFKYVRNGETEPLTELISLTPDLTTIREGCGETISHPSDETKSVCTLFRVVAQIRLFLKSQVVSDHGHVTKILNTRIDYKTFLELTEIDRILQVVQDTQNALPSLFSWLNSEVTKTINDRFKGVRTYFQKVESFNRDKARADVDFVNDRLDMFRKSVSTLSQELGANLDDLIKRAIAAIALEIAEDTFQVGLAAAVVMNPLEKIFGGSSVGDFVDRSAKLADSITIAEELVQVKRSFDRLTEKTVEISGKFQGNSEFLECVKKIVDGIRNEESSSIFESEKQKFIRNYTDYDPKVTRPELTAMAATWTDLIEATCDVIMNTETLVAGTVKATVRASGLCPRTKLLAERMIETYAEIYDFQFELIEALATYMRAATSIDAASSITARYEQLPAEQDSSSDAVNNLKIVGLISYISYKVNIWQATEAYCDVLEYKEGGTRPNLCRGLNTNIPNLVSRQVRPCQEKVGFREVPISAATDADKAYLDISNLYAAKQVRFKIPNSDWLVENQWIDRGDKNSVITVKKFEIFLPTMSGIRRRVNVEAKSEGRNQLVPNGKTYTIIPNKNLKFEYLEGGSNEGCRQETFQNPYDTSKPEICPVNMEEDRCLDLLERTALYPSVYADWKMSISGYESDAVPQLASNFKLKVGITLCVANGSNKKKRKKKLRSLKQKAKGSKAA